MAKVTISDKFFYDIRIELLSALSGLRFYECIGLLIYIFERCKRENLTEITKEQLIEFSPFNSEEFINAMIRAHYFTQKEDSDLFLINMKGIN